MYRSLQEQVYYEGPVELGFAGAKPQLRAMPISSRTDNPKLVIRPATADFVMVTPRYKLIADS
ncbi:uncharacterized protein PGTG_22541 [Puccinia graminis f. sp. tritici CRL 75-36-700-3]|uniref:Uncharacterized protein n=1 Tax=Puccinia graminis f. sp. tritici (strain CRL 75-36-700-3 / race SCCL) TaxID=418459 RepID=H6QUV1_PUCGT|nr:uncharacterized protein PGTG_22541 [Puccinia graminis f. sp. tritici CRL 75-36-700-3]EHS64859.1 hypothetical protein PGTG_22541 [Puccinia graminis f. sp. tritici CRL 75-36-700-3]